jgi:hypothetical protein
MYPMARGTTLFAGKAHVIDTSFVSPLAFLRHGGNQRRNARDRDRERIPASHPGAIAPRLDCGCSLVLRVPPEDSQRPGVGGVLLNACSELTRESEGLRRRGGGLNYCCLCDRVYGAILYRFGSAKFLRTVLVTIVVTWPLAKATPSGPGGYCGY